MNFSGFAAHAAEFLPLLLQGAVVTVQVTLLSFMLSAGLGLLLALLRQSRLKPLSWGSAAEIGRAHV